VSPGTSRTRPAELWALIGFGTFGLHPEWIPPSPLAGWFYSISFELFGQGQIIVAFSALAFVLTRRAGLRWLPVLGVVCALSWVSEHLGTGYGLPFGHYAYTELLGPKLGGRVPALIPLSWFFMAVPSWALARLAAPSDDRKLLRIGLGAAWMIVWDFSLDPAMSFVTPYWRWEQAGIFYGMPLINLGGWAATSLVLMGAIEILSERSGLPELPIRWVAGFYAIVLLLPLGMVVAAGLWPAVAATLVGVSGLSLATVRSPRRVSGNDPAIADLGQPSEPAWTQ